MNPVTRSLACTLLSAFAAVAPLGAQSSGPYARIAILRPHDGKTVDFESGYIRHLDWHRQAGDKWTWYGWSVTHGDRQRWFVYATFGHAIADFDNSVAPADDERDNVLNVTPHAEFAGSALFEFLPALSRGSGVPSATPRVEMTTVHVNAGATQAFESAMAVAQPGSSGETLWYRMVAGGASPRYVRLRPRPTIAAVVESRAALPDAVHAMIAASTVEILTLRPAMSLGVVPQPP
jgi:hypothetical protein